MNVTTPISDELTKYLDLSSTELKLTGQNMANIDTPGYRTVGFDFTDAMKHAMSDALGARSGSTLAASEVPIGEVDGLLERPDGNNVSMDREGLNMAEAQLQFRTGIELLRRENTRVMDAIHAN